MGRDVDGERQDRDGGETMKATSSRWLLMTGLAMGLVACGDDATPGPADTAGGDTVADTSNPDTSAPDTSAPDTNTPDVTRPDVTIQDTNTGDTNPGDTNTGDTNQPGCDRTTFAGTAYFEHDAEFGYTTFGLENDTAFLAVEFYDFGDGSPLTGPGNYPLGANADDQNYETCTTCLIIYADCDAETCAKSFYGTGGTIEVTALDLDAGTVTATLKNVVAVEVTIDENTFVSTPVNNGETFCLGSLSIAP